MSHGQLKHYKSQYKLGKKKRKQKSSSNIFSHISIWTLGGTIKRLYTVVLYIYCKCRTLKGIWYSWHSIPDYLNSYSKLNCRVILNIYLVYQEDGRKYQVLPPKRFQSVLHKHLDLRQWCCFLPQRPQDCALLEVSLSYKLVNSCQVVHYVSLPQPHRDSSSELKTKCHCTFVTIQNM